MRTRILLLAVLVSLPMLAQRQRVARPAQLRDDGTTVTLPPGRNLAIGTTVLGPTQKDLGPSIRAAAIGADGALYVGMGSSIKKSTDDGTTWTTLHSFTSTSLQMLYAAANGYLYASPASGPTIAAERGLWRSTNGGASWARVLDLSALTTASIWGFAEDSNGVLYAGEYTLDAEEAPVIFRSADDGATFTAVYTDADGRHIHAIEVDANDVVYASLGDDVAPWNVHKILKSANGTDWAEVLSGMGQAVGIGITPTARVFGSDSSTAAIFRTTNDTTYTTALMPVPAAFNFWIRRDPATNYLYAGFVSSDASPQTAYIYRSIDDGVSWATRPAARQQHRQRQDGGRHCLRWHGEFHVAVSGELQRLRGSAASACGDHDPCRHGATLRSPLGCD
jgi:hypothetical protein